MKVELKPCPFCGGKACIMFDDKPDSLGRIGEWAECVRCGAMGPYWKRRTKTHQGATRDWNRREGELMIDACELDRLKDMEAAVKTLLYSYDHDMEMTVTDCMETLREIIRGGENEPPL